MSQEIGFVGVGNMGSRMARNLLDDGYDVIVFDIDDERLQAMREAGADTATSPREIAERSDIVMSSLPTDEAIETAYLGPDGVLAGVSPGSLLVEMSTANPSITRQIQEALPDPNVALVDAPVIGTPPVAAAANLTIMVGGTESAFDRAAPILETLGESVYHVGGLGSGHESKLLNNMVLLGQYAIAAEAFAMAGQLSVSEETLYEVITSGIASSELIETKVSKALSGNFDPSDGARIDNARKDLKYALEMGNEESHTMPITAVIKEHFTLAAMVGEGNQDYSVLLQVLKDLAE